MSANVRELDEVVMIVKEIEDDGIRHLLQRRDIQSSVFLNGLKCIVDSADCIDARLFLDHIGRRCELVAWIHGGHSDRLDAELVESANIVNCNRLTLDEIASPCGIEQTLPKYHAILQL